MLLTKENIINSEYPVNIKPMQLFRVLQTCGNKNDMIKIIKSIKRE
jgi:hypothetical protein